MSLLFSQISYVVSINTLILLSFGISIVSNSNAEGFKISKTIENVPQKTLIVKKDAKLFKSAEGEQAEKASFMQLYFLMSPEKNNRVPVSKSFSVDKTQPDGWLEKETFIVWNSIQMIDFESQQQRGIVKIFNSRECAQQFSKEEPLNGCQELGKEPKHQNNKKQHRFLIPVFQHDKESYHAGFVSIQEEDKVIKPMEFATTVGYDLVLVIDSTFSMNRYFHSTIMAVQTFVKNIQESMKTSNVMPSLSIGLLFYRDRDLKNKNCKVGYLTKWAQPLTEKLEKVLDALNHAESTKCNDLDDPEAVFDGLYRAIVDTEWHNNYFKSIILIGDAPPHLPSNIEKNPLQLNGESINKLASERNIRFLTFKIGNENFKEFKELALSSEASRLGRFNIIEKGNVLQFEKDLQKALFDEWGIVVKTQTILNSRKNESSSYLSSQRKDVDISDYEYPIILSNLHFTFITGWVPQKVKGKLAFSEYVFMKKNDLQILINNLDSINISFTEGLREGGEMVINTIRDTLASQLRMRSGEIFQPGESLGDLLKKAYALPFHSKTLSFTPEQINTFKPSDYQGINNILSEKVKYLREFAANPQNFHDLGGTTYLYIPQTYFP